tara:strand:- start:2966 stop:5641 length:2676 start_codon:yes stop_codon:yes gene_type:complete
MAVCNPTTVEKEQRIKEIDNLFDSWLKKDNIKKRFTYNGFYDLNASMASFEKLMSQRLELPFDFDTPFQAHHFRRMKVEMNAYNNALGGKFGDFIFAVPEGLSKQDPVSRHFYTKLNEILGHERVNVSTIMEHSKKMMNHLFEAYISENQASGGLTARVLGPKRGNKAIKELRGIRDELVNQDATDQTFSKFVEKMEKFIESDGGITVRQFRDLIQMNNLEFQTALSGKDKRVYNSHVVQAVKEAKKMMANMGHVYINGLNQFKKLIALKYINSSNTQNAKIQNPTAKRMIERVEDYVSKMERLIDPDKKKDYKQWAESGGYFPHTQFESIVEIKSKISKAIDSNMKTKNSNFEGVIKDIFDTIDLKAVPDHVKDRNVSLKKFWEVDPSFVINEYGHQAVQFNKMIHTQVQYLRALKNIPQSDLNFVKGLKRFIDEEYTVFTEGIKGRSNWTNNAVLALTAYQTARTMGLNFTGGVKNWLSAAHFYSRVGYKSLFDTASSYNADKTFRDTMDRVESKQGFRFKDAARELYNEGMISRTDYESGQYRFDPETGKLLKGNDLLKDALIDAGQWTLDKALIFHRITENNSRKWMFRTAFYKKYTSLIDNGYDTVKAEKFAQNFALQMVNSFAYEYAKHAKAKIVRGFGKTVEEFENGSITRKLADSALGATTEVAFQLMHYPLSLIETQTSQFKGSIKAVLAKQGLSESADMQYFARYAGTSLMVALTSALLNTNLFNLFENETQQRITRVIDDLTEYDNPDKGTFGLLSEFTGPTIGHLKYLMIAAGIIDLDESTLNKILFGNVDFSNPNDKQTELYNAYQYSTAWGVFKNKIKPSLEAGRGGRDLFTHYFKAYPSTWTKKGHEMIWGKKAKKNRKSQESQAIKVLEGMLRGR